MRPVVGLEHAWGGARNVVTAAALLLALLTVPRGVSAQQAQRVLPSIATLRAEPRSDASGPLAPDLLFTPLRLSLTSGLPASGPFIPGCDERAEASGNSVNGFAVKRYTFLDLGPNLVLHGFSSFGCSADAGIGGGVTYWVPLSKTLSLVASAGAYGLPTPGLATSSVVTSSGRLDLVKRLGWGRTLTFGLGTRVRTRDGLFSGVGFGGSF
jgi:hypothetical protein